MKISSGLEHGYPITETTFRTSDDKVFESSSEAREHQKYIDVEGYLRKHMLVKITVPNVLYDQYIRAVTEILIADYNSPDNELGQIIGYMES